MGISSDQTVTSTRTRFAGAGDVTISQDRGAGAAVRWGVGEGAAPTGRCHALNIGELVPMTLAGTEALYMWTETAGDTATVGVTRDTA